MSKMRKTLATFVLTALLFVAIPLAANAQTRCRTGNRRSNAARSQRYYSPARVARSNYYARNSYYAERQRPSFYRRHRNLINLGIATGAGAGIGAIAGGKRGALIGTAAGAGLGALYTYVLKAKKRRY